MPVSITPNEEPAATPRDGLQLVSTTLHLCKKDSTHDLYHACPARV